jgi:hypothetical protein
MSSVWRRASCSRAATFPLMFLSGMFFPLAAMPQLAQWVRRGAAHHTARERDARRRPRRRRDRRPRRRPREAPRLGARRAPARPPELPHGRRVAGTGAPEARTATKRRARRAPEAAPAGVQRPGAAYQPDRNETGPHRAAIRDPAPCRSMTSPLAPKPTCRRLRARRGCGAPSWPRAIPLFDIRPYVADDGPPHGAELQGATSVQSHS